MDRPRILDLFCGAGGAAMGYHRAGFDVVGVDIRPQPHYPFEFHQADALDVLDCETQSGREWNWRRFDAIHASPPCQRYSTATKRNGTQGDHPDLIAETRLLLRATALPYVIENVVGAPLINPVLVCGTRLGLAAGGYRLRRHRIFETNWPIWPLAAGFGCGCHGDVRPVLDVTGGDPTKKARADDGGGRPHKDTADEARRIMGIDWMTKAELNEAIPPAYTELIGAQLRQHIQQDALLERMPPTSHAP